MYTLLRNLKNNIQIDFITFVTSDIALVTNIHCLDYCKSLQSSFSLLSSQNIPFKTQLIAYHFHISLLGLLWQYGTDYVTKKQTFIYHRSEESKIKVQVYVVPGESPVSLASSHVLSVPSHSKEYNFSLFL